MDKALRYLAGFGLPYIVLALFCLPRYIGVTSLNIQLGVLALLLTARIDRSRTGSWRYGITAVLCLLLLYSVPANTFIYLSIVMALAFAVESYAGRLNLLPLLVLVFMSPIFGSLSDLFQLSHPFVYHKAGGDYTQRFWAKGPYRRKCDLAEWCGVCSRSGLYGPAYVLSILAGRLYAHRHMAKEVFSAFAGRPGVCFAVMHRIAERTIQPVKDNSVGTVQHSTRKHTA